MASAGTRDRFHHLTATRDTRLPTARTVLEMERERESNPIFHIDFALVFFFSSLPLSALEEMSEVKNAKDK